MPSDEVDVDNRLSETIDDEPQMVLAEGNLDAGQDSKLCRSRSTRTRWVFYLDPAGVNRSSSGVYRLPGAPPVVVA